MVDGPADRPQSRSHETTRSRVQASAFPLRNGVGTCPRATRWRKAFSLTPRLAASRSLRRTTPTSPPTWNQQVSLDNHLPPIPVAAQRECHYRHQRICTARSNITPAFSEGTARSRNTSANSRIDQLPFL